MYAASASSTMGAKVHPESTGTAVASGIVTITSHNCDDPRHSRHDSPATIPQMHVLRELIALLAPPGCVGCGRALAGADARLCPECVRALPWLRRGCPRCGLPKHRGRRCPAAHAAFPRSWAPMAYQGVARRLVAALKFRGALPVADVMAAQMAANLPSDLRARLAPRG